jgi:hypothetical protein
MLPDGITIQQLMKDMDLSQDGKISFAEFKAYMRRGAYIGERRWEANDEVAHDVPNIDVSSAIEAPVLPEESLHVVFRSLAPVFRRSETELSEIAEHLKARHWLHTVRDLQALGPAEWSRLDLPIKLELELRSRYCDSCGMTSAQSAADRGSPTSLATTRQLGKQQL